MQAHDVLGFMRAPGLVMLKCPACMRPLQGLQPGERTVLKLGSVRQALVQFVYRRHYLGQRRGSPE